MKVITSVVLEGEVVVVGDFWSEAEREVLSVRHLVFVHRTHRFNDLKRKNTQKRTSHKDTACVKIPHAGEFCGVSSRSPNLQTLAQFKARTRTFPGATLSHIRTSLLVANSGGLSFTSFTLMLTRTLVSWWWPPTYTHTEDRPHHHVLLLTKLLEAVSQS